MMQAKTIYSYDLKSFDYLGARLEPNNYKLVSGETLVTPPADLIKRKFDVSAQKWTGEKAPLESSLEQKMLMQQSQQLAVMQSMMMQQNQANAKLQSANEQQAKQIKQLQQMFMTANQQQAVEDKEGDSQQ